MNKSKILAGATLTVASLLAPAAVVNATAVDCASVAIWTQDSSGLVKKWSPTGELLGEVSGVPSSFDIAVTSDLSAIVTLVDNELKFWSTETGAEVPSSTVSLSAPLSQGRGSGIVSGGRFLTDSGDKVYSVNLSNGAVTLYADLSNANSSLPAGVTNGTWSIAGDLLQLENGDILAIVNDSTNARDVLGIDFTGVLLRINGDDPNVITVVGTYDLGEVYGAARAGDEIYLATGSGELVRLASIPSTASMALVSLTPVVQDGDEDDYVSFYGAAGSNDSTDGPTGCTANSVAATPTPEPSASAAPAAAAASPASLAKTGAETAMTSALFAGSLAIIALGAGLVLSRRRTKA